MTWGGPWWKGWNNNLKNMNRPSDSRCRESRVDTRTLASSREPHPLRRRLWHVALEGEWRHQQKVSTKSIEQNPMKKLKNWAVWQRGCCTLSALAQKWAVTKWLKVLRLVNHCLGHRFHMMIASQKLSVSVRDWITSATWTNRSSLGAKYTYARP